VASPEVAIYGAQDDASRIEGFTIVVDVLRAFSVAYYVNQCAPARYLAVGSLERAFALRDADPDVILIGERQGSKVEGFDYGNSPTEIGGRDFSGRTVVHTTTAGTKGLLAQPAANEVVVGSFVNIDALIGLIEACGLSRVNVYCTALPGQAMGEEDYLFADFLKERLAGGDPDFQAIVSRLGGRTGRSFSPEGFAPYSDFELCMRLGAFDAVLARQSIGNDDMVELRLCWP
jgi:2-phosphosulfolactate phosphatase